MTAPQHQESSMISLPTVMIAEFGLPTGCFKEQIAKSLNFRRVQMDNFWATEVSTSFWVTVFEIVLTCIPQGIELSETALETRKTS